MVEYIKREEAIDACFNGWNNNAHDCAANIRNIPAADVVERKTGKWIEIRMGSINPLTGRAGVYVGCSECHASIPSDSQLDFIDESDCKFCYNCGAKMEVLIDV